MSKVEAQALSGEGRHDEVTAQPRELIDLYGGLAANNGRANTLNKLAVAEAALANIAVAGGGWDVACAAVARARERIGELLRRGTLLVSVDHYGSGVADNTRRCAVGAAFAVIK